MPVAVARSLEILWLSGLSPVDVTSGLAMYTTGLTESVAAAGNVVRGIGIDSTLSDRRGHTAARLTIWTAVKSDPHGLVRSLLSLHPHIASRLSVPKHRVAVDEALSRDPDVVVVDHLMSAWCLAKVLAWRDRTGGVFSYVSHNCESIVRREWARTSSPISIEGLYLRFDAVRIRRLERKVLATADVVTTTTLADRRAIAGSVDFERSLVLTPGWTRNEPVESLPLAERPRQVVVLGSLDWQAKRENLEAVVAAFDEPFAEAGIALLVVGSGDEAFLARQAGRWRATEFLGHVPDADEVLATCRLGVVAEPVGGGFKLKVLDYGFGGLPMAILDGSVAGLDFEPGHDVLVASTIEDLAAEIIGAIDDGERLARMARSVRQRLEGRHDWSDRGEQLSLRLRTQVSQRAVAQATSRDAA